MHDFARFILFHQYLHRIYAVHSRELAEILYILWKVRHDLDCAESAVNTLINLTIHFILKYSLV